MPCRSAWRGNGAIVAHHLPGGGGFGSIERRFPGVQSVGPRPASRVPGLGLPARQSSWVGAPTSEERAGRPWGGPRAPARLQAVPDLPDSAGTKLCRNGRMDCAQSPRARPGTPAEIPSRIEARSGGTGARSGEAAGPFVRTALKMAGIAATCENWTAIRRESTRSPSPEKGAGRMRAVPQRMIRAIARVLPTKRVRRGATPQSSTWLRRRATLDTGGVILLILRRTELGPRVPFSAGNDQSHSDKTKYDPQLLDRFHLLL